MAVCSKTAAMRGGGGIAVEERAGLRMHGGESVGDVSTNSGDGGFLLARFAAPLLLQNVSISKASSGPRGGGGALTVYSSKIALDSVSVKDCAAGIRGGGGILLESAAEAHLVGGCVLFNNTAPDGYGGNIRLSASRLSVGGASESLLWPARKPIFNTEMTLSAHSSGEIGEMRVHPNIISEEGRSLAVAYSAWPASCLTTIVYGPGTDLKLYSIW